MKLIEFAVHLMEREVVKYGKTNVIGATKKTEIETSKLIFHGYGGYNDLDGGVKCGNLIGGGVPP